MGLFKKDDTNSLKILKLIVLDGGSDLHPCKDNFLHGVPWLGFRQDVQEDTAQIKCEKLGMKENLCLLGCGNFYKHIIDIAYHIHSISYT